IGARSRHVGSREWRTWTVKLISLPLKLIEGFERQIVGQADRRIDRPDRNQTFLDFRAGAAESIHVDRVDGVDTVEQKGRFTPADDLLAEPDVERKTANVVV